MAKKKAAKAKKKTTRRAPKPAKKKAARAKPRAKATAAAGAAKATPYLCVKGGVAALDFYEKAFGAVEKMRIVGKDGSLGHADIEIEGAGIMLSDEYPDGGVFSPHTLGGTPVTVHLYVANVDAFARRAVAAGAIVLRAVEDQPYGDRAGTLRDPFGHRWMVSSKKEDVSKQEMERRFGGAYLVS
ncbi:MAG TPA: VOC family protein [Myxococcota bacterium]|nr:VOC family protein [Myxococcota bacterium]